MQGRYPDRTILGSVDVFNTDQQGGSTSNGTPQQSTLGSSVHLRKLPPAGAPQTNAAPPPPPPPVAAPANGSSIGPDVIDKFERAYENVGVFEHNGRGARGLAVGGEIALGERAAVAFRLRSQVLEGVEP